MNYTTLDDDVLKTRMESNPQHMIQELPSNLKTLRGLRFKEYLQKNEKVNKEGVKLVKINKEQRWAIYNSFLTRQQNESFQNES